VPTYVPGGISPSSSAFYNDGPSATPGQAPADASSTATHAPASASATEQTEHAQQRADRDEVIVIDGHAST
jgi:hypothetical protein